MKCRTHFFDFSSGVGVCATCLRERLNILIQTQSNHQTVLLVRPHLDEQQQDQHRNSDATHPQIVFPRSVSPYVSRRKSDNTPAHLHRFYSTPQIGPGGELDTTSRAARFSILGKLFRSKTHNTHMDAKRRYADEIPEAVTQTTSSWFSYLFTSKSKKKNNNNNNNKKKMWSKSLPAFGNRRGMSPAAESDEECGDRFSDYSTQASPWKETPVRATPRRQTHRNVAGMAFCLSPLVRPSPNRSWTQKGVMPESMAPTGDVRVPVKPHLAEAASFRGNRSRKLANFGRFNPKY